MRLGIDIDGVLYDAESQMRRLLERSAYRFPRPSPSWFWLRNQVQPEEWRWLWNEGLHDLFTSGQDYPGAVDFVRALGLAEEVVLITSRPAVVHSLTLEYAERFGAAEVHVLSGAAKAPVPCDIYLDDYEENVYECWANTPAEVVIWDRPWNQGFSLPDRFHRIRSWEEFAWLIDS